MEGEVISEESFVQSSKGLNLFSKWWKLKDSSPRALIFVSHGVGEHCSRYEDFARVLAKQGFFVVSHDHGKCVIMKMNLWVTPGRTILQTSLLQVTFHRLQAPYWDYTLISFGQAASIVTGAMGAAMRQGELAAMNEEFSPSTRRREIPSINND